MENHRHPGWSDNPTAQAPAVATTRDEVPLRPGQWLAPREVWLSADETQLLYPAPGNWRPTNADAGLLAQFIKLGSATPETIRRFALRYGVLELCRHGVPFRHSDPDNEPAIDLDFEPGDLASIEQLLSDGTVRHVCTRTSTTGTDGSERCWESIAHWRQHAQRADALVQAVERLTAANPVDRRMLQIALGLGEADPVPDRLRLREWLAAAVNAWLTLGGHARVSVAIDGKGKPHFVVDSAGVFAALGQQLGSRIVNPTGNLIAIGERIALCCECGLPYVTTRKVREDRNNYCHECGAGDGYKKAKREHARASRARANGAER